MPSYTAPLADQRFLLHALLKVGQLGEDAETIDAVLDEGARLAEQVLQPVNQSGDAEGCRFENGVVRTPAGFVEAYRAFAEGGWAGVVAAPEYGGQGLPGVVNLALGEMFAAANLSLSIYPALSQGAYNALAAFGSPEQKQLYLPKLASGVWSGTMCLTEPQCGSDLGLVRTKAEPGADCSYRISGTKIFISAGEHDLTRNIVHLVLARLPGAPTGTRGLSLFVVPKFLPEGDGEGARNGVWCRSIEHKMGIRGSATATLGFEDATGWLVGEPHRGMRAMFVMMNAARMMVGMEGLGLAEVAYQNARDYARARLQGRSPSGAKAPDQPADPLIVHPDIRRMLMTARAGIEGARALALWVGLAADRAARDPDPAEREAADELVQLMTPVVKASLTDLGSSVANLGVQVFGGAGYIVETGIEQFVRDARITQIYEGTNGIQALDLVGRKLPQRTGRLLRRFFHPVNRFLHENAANFMLADFTAPLAQAFGRLQQTTAWLADAGLKDPEDAAAGASDYLNLLSLTAQGWLWARMAAVSQARMRRGEGDAAFHEAKIATGRFFMARMLPQAGALGRAAMSGKRPVMALDEAAF